MYIRVCIYICMYLYVLMHMHEKYYNYDYITGGEDYEAPENQYIKVIFPAGKTRVSFDIIINDDNDMEGSETFRITIYDLSVPYDINLGSITSATINILDNDSKHTVAVYMQCIV